MWSLVPGLMLISHPDLTTTSFALDSQLWVLGEQVNGLIARQGSLLDFPLVLTSTSVICPDLVVLFSLLSFDSLGRVDSHDNGLSDRSFVFVSQSLRLTRLVILTFLSRALVFWTFMSVVLWPGPSPFLSSLLTQLRSSVGRGPLREPCFPEPPLVFCDLIFLF